MPKQEKGVLSSCLVGVGGDLPALSIQKMFSQAPPGAKSFLQISSNAHYQPNHLPLGSKCVSAVEAPPDQATSLSLLDGGREWGLTRWWGQVTTPNWWEGMSQWL